MIWKVISNDRLVFHWRLESERLSKSTEAVSQWPNRTNQGFLKPMNWEDQTMVHDDSKQPGSSLAPLTVASDVKFAGKCSEQSPTTPSVLGVFHRLPETHRGAGTSRPQFIAWRFDQNVEIDCFPNVVQFEQFVFFSCPFQTTVLLFIWKGGLQVFGEFTVKSADFINPTLSQCIYINRVSLFSVFGRPCWNIITNRSQPKHLAVKPGQPKHLAGPKYLAERGTHQNA